MLRPCVMAESADTPPACPRQPYALLSVIAGVLTCPRHVGRTRFASPGSPGANLTLRSRQDTRPQALCPLRATHTDARLLTAPTTYMPPACRASTLRALSMTLT